MNALDPVAEVFWPEPTPDQDLLVKTLRVKDVHAAVLETRFAADSEAKPVLEAALSQAIGEDDAKAEKTVRAKLVEVDQHLRELPPAVKVARAHEKAARQELAEALLPESEKASVELARTAEQAVQVLRDAVFEWAAGRRRHVTILGSVGQAALKNTRPPAAIGFTQPRGDLVGQLLSVLLDQDKKWV